MPKSKNETWWESLTKVPSRMAENRRRKETEKERQVAKRLQQKLSFAKHLGVDENGQPIMLPQVGYLGPGDAEFTYPYNRAKVLQQRPEVGETPFSVYKKPYKVVPQAEQNKRMYPPAHREVGWPETIWYGTRVGVQNIVPAAARLLGQKFFKDSEKLSRYSDAGLREEPEKEGNIDKTKIPLVMEAWQFCFASYREGAEFDDWDYDWLLYNGENAGYVAQKSVGDKVSYVFAFRGSQSFHDMADDVGSGSRSWGIDKYCEEKLSITVYGASGPAIRVKALEPQLDKYIRVICQDPESVDKILITGHSLGGGTAAVFAAVFIQLLPPDFDMNKLYYITFEAMRGLTSGTVQQLLSTTRGMELDKRGIRVANALDPVPHLPPRSLGFAHIGETWYLKGRFIDDMTDDLTDAFNVNHGPHSMKPTSSTIENLGLLRDDPNFDNEAFVAKGRGVSLRKKRKGRFKKGSKEAKQYMAYLRSLRKS